MSDFVGSGGPLTSAGLGASCDRLGVSLPQLWAVLKVETSGFGFLRDRRPQILFERHVFHHLTNGRFDVTAPDVSDPVPGGYGAGGAHQYDRLAQAITLDRMAALQSASWGIGQVMGRNAQMVGFADIETMVREMAGSEDAQLHGMVGYVKAAGIDTALQHKDWAVFARAYNGKNYAERGYHTKLADACTHFELNGTPDLSIRTAQVFLTYRGFEPGPVDGIVGNRTKDALVRFQHARGLPENGSPDPVTLAALAAL